VELLVKAVEPEEAIGVVVPVQDVAESRAVAIVVLVVKAVDWAETTGVVVPVQGVAEPRAAVTVELLARAVDLAEAIGVESKVAVTVVSAVKAVDLGEAIGAVVLEPSVAEATAKVMLVTSLRRIEEDAAEKDSYIDSSHMPCGKVGLPHLAADGIRRALYWIRHAEKAWNIRIGSTLSKSQAREKQAPLQTHEPSPLCLAPFASGQCGS